MLADGGRRSDASKKGDSMGCLNGVGASMFCRRLEVCRLDESEVSMSGSSTSASGEDTFGACLLRVVVVEESLTCLTGKRPFVPPTVTCFAFAVRMEGLGERLEPWPGISTCSPWDLSPGVVTVLELTPDRDVEEVFDLTETIRGANLPAVTAVAGMG